VSRFPRGNMHRISVLLVDDHELVRRGFRRILEEEPDICVAGEAGDGPEAVEQAQQLRPSVVVMDFALPSMNGAVATRQILKANPETAVLILSMHAESSYVRTCLDAGARGYLLKNAMDLELVETVRRVAEGARVLDRRLGAAAEPEGSRPNLTTRELEIVQLIVDGKSNKDIAVVLGLSANTVAVHRANIMQALDVHNTAEMVVVAIRQGLVSIA
jgi:DNA-binding NarL/FixJ family response regulator